MKMANEKQSIYINKLTYALYKLRGCNNFTTVVSVEDAMKISADIASDMIHQLKTKVNEEEYEQYVKPYVRAFAERVTLKPFSVAEYKKVDRVSPVDDHLLIYTTDGSEYNLNEEYEYIIGTVATTIRGVYNKLVNAINHNLGVSFLINNGLCVVTIEDIERDKAINDTIELINDVLDITDGLLFKDHKGNFTADYVGIVLKFVEIRNSKVANKLGAILNNPKECQFFCSILSGSQQHFYGIQ